MHLPTREKEEHLDVKDGHACKMSLKKTALCKLSP